MLTDQQRKGSLGCYGMPDLGCLARSGVRFSRNYVANPTCMP